MEFCSQIYFSDTLALFNIGVTFDIGELQFRIDARSIRKAETI
jgi:hypothetical protein